MKTPRAPIKSLKLPPAALDSRSDASDTHGDSTPRASMHQPPYYFASATVTMRSHRQLLVDIILENKLSCSFEGLIPDGRNPFCLFELPPGVLDRDVAFIRLELERSIMLQCYVELEIDKIYGENVGRDLYAHARNFLLQLVEGYDEIRPSGERSLREYPTLVDARKALMGMHGVKPSPTLSPPNKSHAQPIVTNRSPFLRAQSPGQSSRASQVSTDNRGVVSGKSNFLQVPAGRASSSASLRPQSSYGYDSLGDSTYDEGSSVGYSDSTVDPETRGRQLRREDIQNNAKQGYSTQQGHQSPPSNQRIPDINLQPPTPRHGTAEANKARRATHIDGRIHRTGDLDLDPRTNPGSLILERPLRPVIPATRAKDVPTVAELVRAKSVMVPRAEHRPVRPESSISQRSRPRPLSPRTDGRHRNPLPSAINVEGSTATTAARRKTLSPPHHSIVFSPNPAVPGFISPPGSRIPRPAKVVSPRQSALPTIEESLNEVSPTADKRDKRAVSMIVEGSNKGHLVRNNRYVRYVSQQRAVSGTATTISNQVKERKENKEATVTKDKAKKGKRYSLPSLPWK